LASLSKARSSVAGGARRGRVLAGDQQAVGDHVDPPVCGLGEVAALRLKFVLYKKGHHMSQPHRFFLGIGEAGEVFALDQGPTLGRLYMVERARRVANMRWACRQLGTLRSV
jgi:hypothetical protein